MPLYDCGNPSCVECQRAFGDRRRATAEYFARAFQDCCTNTGASQLSAHLCAEQLYGMIRDRPTDAQRRAYDGALRAIPETPENIGPLLRFRPAEAARRAA